MILDSFKNAIYCEILHSRFKEAFEFLRITDLATLPLGRIELDNKNLFVNVQEIEGKTSEATLMETHNKYIDIQTPISGTEIIGWIARSNLKRIEKSYNAENDMALYADKTDNLFRVQPGEFAIFFPEDGHQPGIGEGKIKKIIVKVKL